MKPINSTFGFYEEVPDAAPLGISGSDIEAMERRIGGAGGPGGADANILKDCCT